jgi:hypothetical protein
VRVKRALLWAGWAACVAAAVVLGAVTMLIPLPWVKRTGTRLRQRLDGRPADPGGWRP